MNRKLIIIFFLLSKETNFLNFLLVILGIRKFWLPVYKILIGLHLPFLLVTPFLINNHQHYNNFHSISGILVFFDVFIFHLIAYLGFSFPTHLASWHMRLPSLDSSSRTELSKINNVLNILKMFVLCRRVFMNVEARSSLF